ncbi:hypothetical protein [Mucilaginibacter sp.]
MKYPVLVWPFLKVSGMALYPFIVVQQADMKQDAVIIRHETIHIKQAQEMLVLPFYLLYLLNYLFNLLIYRNHNRAYLNIIFEREAYRYEGDAGYLARRPFWGWLFSH